MLHSFKLKLFRSAIITEVHDDAVRSRFCACAYGLDRRGFYPLARPWLAWIMRGLYPFVAYSPCWYDKHSKLTSKAANLSE